MKEIKVKMMFKLFVVVLFLFYVAPSKAAADEILDDANLNFTGIAIKYKIPCEEYDVTTKDGYILKLFHIPGNKRKPVLLMHGLMESADSMIVLGNTSIVNSLSKAGYDVWAGNYRGNIYSRRHVTLNPDIDSAFWDFCMHEHGVSDLSTYIDFILNKTKNKRLSFIGASEGNILMFILASVRPEYNDKIKIFIAIAPVVYMQYVVMRMPILLSIATIIRSFIIGMNLQEIMNHDSLPAVMSRNLCKLNLQLCVSITNAVIGYDDGIEPEHMRVMVSHFPASSSRKNLDHYYQIMLLRRFAQFDYGPKENLARYNSTIPPVYDLRKVAMKVAMFIAEYDSFSSPEDLRDIKKQLPNIVFSKTFKNTNHFGFGHSRYAHIRVYPNVIRVLEKYT